MDTKLDPKDTIYDPTHELGDNYRSISKAAVTGFIFSIMGVLFIVFSLLILLPILALGLSLIGIAAIKRHPEEFVGLKIANMGLTLSVLTLAGGVAWHAYVYMTEVPDGYERISYRMLKDDTSTDLPYSEKATELHGKKVFLKGYVRPGVRRINLKEFIMVGDFGSCCFGGSPDITDVVAVSIQGKKRVNYGYRLRKIAGKFRLNDRAMPTREKEVPKVYYQIDADIVK